MSDIKRKRMRQVCAIAFATLFLASLLVRSTAQVEPAAVFSLRRSVIGGGGGQSVGDGHSLGGTVGQSALGIRETDSQYLCVGFWCGQGQYSVYLPLTARSWSYDRP
jgi:hypothetical protein